MRGRQGRGDLVGDGEGFVQTERAGLQHLGEVPAAHKPHDQIGAGAVAPVVVQRHDVWMLQARNDLRLLLEPSDERGVVREPGVDLLDGDLATDSGVERPPHHPEGTFSDLLDQPVAPERRPMQFQPGILLQDLLVKLSEVRRRIDPHLVGEQPPRPIERLQSLPLPARPVEGHHELSPETFAERMAGREVFEFRDRSRVVAERQARIDLVLQGGEPHLLEARDLPFERRGVRQIREGSTAPQRQRLAEARDRLSGIHRELASRAAEQALESKDVHLVRLRVQDVPGRPAFDPFGTQCAPQMGDVALDRVAGRLRRLLLPEPVDQLVHRDDVSGGEEQMREDQPLLRPAEGDRPPAVGHLERPQRAELQRTRCRADAEIWRSCR